MTETQPTPAAPKVFGILSIIFAGLTLLFSLSTGGSAPQDADF